LTTYLSFGHFTAGSLVVTEVTGGSGLGLLQLAAGGIIPTSRQNITLLYQPNTTAQLTFFPVIKNSAASSTVMLGASGQTLYFAAEEVPILTAETTETDSEWFIVDMLI
jgi:hypothetical protein